jgi:hypothetical protein
MSKLAITVVADGPGSRVWRSCGKLWVSSLLRHLWGGRVLVMRNFEQVMFPVERAGLEEAALEPQAGLHCGTGHRGAAECRACLLEAAESTVGVGEAEWVLLADADCVALRNLDHLFGGSAELLLSRAGGSPDPGFVGVRGARLAELGVRLRQAGGLTAAGLQKVCESGDWRVREFERGEVVRPGDPGVGLKEMADAAVVHFAGLAAGDKQRLAFAFHMMAVYGDRDGLFFDMLET